MKSSDLTEEQAHALKNKLHPMLGSLVKLKPRMVYRGFRPEDPLLIKVLEAEAAMHRQRVDVGCLSCGEVVRWQQKQALG